MCQTGRTNQWRLHGIIVGSSMSDLALPYYIHADTHVRITLPYYYEWINKRIEKLSSVRTECKLRK